MNSVLQLISTRLAFDQIMVAFLSKIFVEKISLIIFPACKSSVNLYVSFPFSGKLSLPHDVVGILRLFNSSSISKSINFKLYFSRLIFFMKFGNIFMYFS